MKIISALLIFANTASLATDQGCSKSNESRLIEQKAVPLKSEYIEMVARQIFTDETGLTNYIGIDCHPINDGKNYFWLCQIRQSATKFENGKYTVNPPGVGVRMLNINFSDNTYKLD